MFEKRDILIFEIFKKYLILQSFTSIGRVDLVIFTWFLILPGPSLLQPVISKTSSVGGDPARKQNLANFPQFLPQGGSEHTFFDAPVKCFDPIQEVLFINSKCNFGIKVGEYSKGGNGCNLFSNKFFFLSKESLLDKVDNLNKTISKKRLWNKCLSLTKIPYRDKISK